MFAFGPATYTMQVWIALWLWNCARRQISMGDLPRNFLDLDRTVLVTSIPVTYQPFLTFNLSQRVLSVSFAVVSLYGLFSLFPEALQPDRQVLNWRSQQCFRCRGGRGQCTAVTQWCGRCFTCLICTWENAGTVIHVYFGADLIVVLSVQAFFTYNL